MRPNDADPHGTHRYLNAQRDQRRRDRESLRRNRWTPPEFIPGDPHAEPPSAPGGDVFALIGVLVALCLVIAVLSVLGVGC